MKHTTLFLIAAIFFYPTFSFGQTGKDITYIESLSNESFPDDFKMFLEKHQDQTIRFFELNKTFELIKLNDVSILTRGNAYGSVSVESMIRYAQESFSKHYPELKEYKLLPFATCVDQGWWRDDVIDFMAIIKSKDKNLHNKIIYLDCHDNRNRPVIIRNSISELILPGEEMTSNVKADTVFFLMKNVGLVNNLKLSRVEFEKKPLIKKEKEFSFSIPYIEVTIRDTAVANNIAKQHFTVDYYDGVRLISQTYIFNDLIKNYDPSIDYSFTQKALTEFKKSLRPSESKSLERYLKEISIDDLLRYAHLKKYEGSDIINSLRIGLFEDELKVKYFSNLNGKKFIKEYDLPQEILSSTDSRLIQYIVKQGLEFSQSEFALSKFFQSISVDYLATLTVKEFKKGTNK